MNLKKVGNILFWIAIVAMLFYVANTFYKRYESKAKLEKTLEQQQQNAGNDLAEKNDKLMAPDFELKDLDGKSVKLSDYKGKIVILNFWATWCPPCRGEIPDLIKASEELSKGDDAVIVAVNLTNGYNNETPDRVKKFVKENNMTMKIILDVESEVATKYGIQSIPTTFIIKKDGSIYNYRVKPISYKEIMDTVKEIK